MVGSSPVVAGDGESRVHVDYDFNGNENAEKVKNNIKNISEKLNCLEKMNVNPTGLTNADTKQLREQIQNKFDQQSKTNKLIFDSIELVACKIKEITEEKFK